jgi:hypothetical protein
VLTIQFRGQRGDRLRFGGSTGFELPSTDTRTFHVPASDALLGAAAERRRVKLRVTVATDAADGSQRLTSARRFLVR